MIPTFSRPEGREDIQTPSCVGMHYCFKFGREEVRHVSHKQGLEGEETGTYQPCVSFDS